MGTRTWVQILLIFVAYKHTAIPPWSYVAVSTDSAPAFAITEWSWLPDGVMPSTNFCVSSWMRVSSVLTMVQFIRIVSGTQSLSFAWASNARVISNSSDLITISTAITNNVWFFVAINVYSSVVYMLIEKWPVLLGGSRGWKLYTRHEFICQGPRKPTNDCKLQVGIVHRRNYQIR